MENDGCNTASLEKGGGSAYAETEGFRLKTAVIVWLLAFTIPQSAALTAPFAREPSGA